MLRDIDRCLLAMDSPLGSWLDIAKIVTPSLLVIFGWAIVHLLGVRLARKSAVANACASECLLLIKEVERVADLAISYHLDHRDEGAELKLKAALSALSLAIEDLIHLGTPLDEVERIRGLVVTFRQATTSHHFEDQHQAGLQSGDTLLAEIRHASNVLMRGLRVARACALKMPLI